MALRSRWTRAVVEEARTHRFGWAYWEFCSLFGAYDAKASAWRKPLLQSLIEGRNKYERIFGPAHK
jgi:endoglucanase